MNLLRLPHDLFLLIAEYLSPRDLICCRRVSRTFHAAFTRSDDNLAFLRRSYPRCRELRLAAAVDAVTCLSDATGDEGGEDNFALLLTLSIEAERETGRDWARVFARVARRYWFLETAQARVVDKVRLAKPPGFDFDRYSCPIFESSPEAHPTYKFIGVEPWGSDPGLGRSDKFFYPTREWAYGHEDALLVYPAPVPSIDWELHDGCEWDDDGVAGWHTDDYAARPPVFARDGAAAAVWKDEDLVRCPYRLRDLETGCEIAVPFNVDGKIMRGVRLVSGVLVFEFVVLETCDPPDEDGHVPTPKHITSIFDVVRVRHSSLSNLSPSSSFPANQQPLWSWSIRWRLDIDMYPEGFLIDDTACFYSTHNANHYAVYVWPGFNEASGVLRVWEITRNAEPLASARAICHLVSRELRFAGVGYFKGLRLRGLELDDHNIYFVEDSYCWPPGTRHERIDLIPRSHLVQTIGMAVIPMPTSAAAFPHLGDDDDSVVYGPHHMRQCGLAGPRFTFCELRGPESDNVFFHHPRSDDAAAPAPLVQPDRTNPLLTGPRFVWQPSRGGAAGVCQTLSSSRAYPFATHREFSALPCWRHDRFPYLTVCEVVDAAAGIRFVARDGFLFKRQGVRFQPALTVRCAARRASNNESRAVRWDDDQQFFQPDGDPAGSISHDGAASLADSLVERELEGRLWKELMGKGYIAGDERWIVGEDATGDVTIVRF